MQLGVNEIKLDVQKNKLRWFGHVMQMRKERICKKLLHTKMTRKLSRARPMMKCIDQIRKSVEMRGEIGKKYKKTGSGRIETAEDFSVIVDPYL